MRTCLSPAYDGFVGDDDIRAAVRRDDGDAAFAALIHAYGRALFDRCLAVLRDRADAEDAMQVTLAKVVNLRGRLPAVVNLRAWLLKVATRTALDALRSAKRHRTRLDRLAQQGDPGEAPMIAAAEPDRAREHAALRAALDDLGPVVHAAFLMRYQDDSSWDEIAATLELEVDAIRMRVKRAMPGLQANLIRRGVTP